MNRQLYYIGLYFWQGLRLLWRNKFWSAITGLIILALLFVVYVFAALSNHASEAGKQADDRLVITAQIAYKQEDPTNFVSVIDAETFADEVRNIEGVKAVRVVTKEEAQQRYVENIKPKAVPSVGIFPESLEITVEDIERIGDINEKISALPEIAQSDYRAEVVKKLTALTGYLRSITLGGAILLTLIALLVIMAVVRTSIHAEERSVAVMSSVGGSLWTIAAPLIVHMVAIILVASTLACVAGWIVDPELGGEFGGNIQNLPSWLQTGRAYGLFELWPLLTGAATLVVSAIVGWGTFKYARR